MKRDNLVLYGSSFIKILASLGILYGLKIQNYIKVLLILLTDMIDCGLPKFFGLYSDTHVCERNHYQRVDKITDSLTYVLLFFYVYQQSLLSTSEIKTIFGLLVYRLIGVIMYLAKNNRKFLFYFPNFFLEVLMVLLFTKNIQYRTILIIFVVMFKLTQEYFLHYVERTKSSFKTFLSQIQLKNIKKMSNTKET